MSFSVTFGGRLGPYGLLLSKKITKRKLDFAIRNILEYDPIMTMPIMILVHFCVVHWTTEPSTGTTRFNLAHYTAA